MLGNTKGKMINQYVPDYVLYDLETTGTSSKYDEGTDSQRGKCSKSYHG